jgi:hypothetical protein
MKKIVAVLILLNMLSSLFSCRNDSVKDNEINGTVEDDTTATVESSQIEQYLTAELAWDLANEYWDNQDGCKDNAAGTVLTAKIVMIDTPNSDANYYRFAFQVEWTSNVDEENESGAPYRVDTHDQILVNAFTGEVTAATYDPNGKVVSVDEAIEIVKNNFFDADILSEEDDYRFEHSADAIAPDHIYVITVQKVVDQQAFFYTREWVDKYTGEIVFEYYICN